MSNHGPGKKYSSNQSLTSSGGSSRQSSQENIALPRASSSSSSVSSSSAALCNTRPKSATEKRHAVKEKGGGGRKEAWGGRKPGAAAASAAAPMVSAVTATDRPHSAGKNEVRRKVEAEGRAARNLVAYSVPLQEEKKSDGCESSKQETTKEDPSKEATTANDSASAKVVASQNNVASPRRPQSLPVQKPTARSRQPQQQYSKQSDSKVSKESAAAAAVSKVGNDGEGASEEESRPTSDVETWKIPFLPPPPPSRSTPRDRSVSGGRSGPSRTRRSTQGSSDSAPSLEQRRKYDRARYWALLFDNLERAVDQIYEMCEGDESETECKEVIRCLERHTKDFHSLIEYWKVRNAYEADPHRHTSVAWEVRKLVSPSGPRHSSLSRRNRSSSRSPINSTRSSRESIVTARRNLGFEKLVPHQPLSSPGPDLHPAEPAVPSPGTKKVCDKNGVGIGNANSSWADRVRGPRQGTTTAKTANAKTTNPKAGSAKNGESFRPVTPVKLSASSSADSAISSCGPSPESSREVSASNLAPSPTPNDVMHDTIVEENESDGWEKVQRMSRKKSGSLCSISSSTSSRSGPPTCNSSKSGTPSSDQNGRRQSSSQVKKSTSTATTISSVVAPPTKKTEGASSATPGGKVHSTPSSSASASSLKSIKSASDSGKRPSSTSLSSSSSTERKSLTEPKPSYERKSSTLKPKAVSDKEEEMRALPEQELTKEVKEKGTAVVTDTTTTPEKKSPEEDNASNNVDEEDSDKSAEKPSIPSPSPATPQRSAKTMTPVKTSVVKTNKSSIRNVNNGSSGKENNKASLSKAKSSPTASNESLKKSGKDPLVKTPSKKTSRPPPRAEETAKKVDAKTVLGEEGKELDSLTVDDSCELDKTISLASEEADRSTEDISSAAAPADSTLPSEEAADEALQCEDDADSLMDEANDALEQQLTQQEEELEREIERERSSELLIEETVKEALMAEVQQQMAEAMQNQRDEEEDVEFDELVRLYDLQAADQSSSWADMVEEAERVSALPPGEIRPPGRSLELHEKLSSPSRKPDISESLKRSEARQATADSLRAKLKKDQMLRLKVLTEKREIIRANLADVAIAKRERMEEKLKKAEEKRKQMLDQKIKKAHVEDEKANEIAFINSLEAQNKRHDVLERRQVQERRMVEREEERQKRQEEKAAKEAAAEQRRLALETDRQARLQELLEKRKMREAKIEEQQQEKERERLEAARLKEKEREARLQELKTQQQASMEELQKKIEKKERDYARRHEEHLEETRAKAFEMSIRHCSSQDDLSELPNPKNVPYPAKKMCTLCNVSIASEVVLQSHLRGKSHRTAVRAKLDPSQDPTQEAMERTNLNHIVDAPDEFVDPAVMAEKERQKAAKKRYKKLRQRMLARGSEFENKLPSASTDAGAFSKNRAKIIKAVKDIQRMLDTQQKGALQPQKLQSLDKSLGELNRILDVNNKTASGTTPDFMDQIALKNVGGIQQLFRIFVHVCDAAAPLPVSAAAAAAPVPTFPVKTVLSVSNIIRHLTLCCFDNANYILLTNKISILIDVAAKQLKCLVPDTADVHEVAAGNPFLKSFVGDAVVQSLLHTVTVVMEALQFGLTASEGSNNNNNNNVNRFRDKVGVDEATFASYTQDVISYVISTGILDKLNYVVFHVTCETGTGNEARLAIDAELGEFMQRILGFLIASTQLLMLREKDKKFEVIRPKKYEDQTQLVSAFRGTGVCGVVSFMYGILLPNCSEDDEQFPLSSSVLSIAILGFRLLNSFSLCDLIAFQTTVGQEGISLEFRHICSFLIRCCLKSMGSNSDLKSSKLTNRFQILLHEVILSIGYFAILNPDNQNVIQSGSRPSILQQLCLLPFQYLSDPKLRSILFPTMISCCYDNAENRIIIEQDLSCVLLANFIEEHIVGQETSPSTVTSLKFEAILALASSTSAFDTRGSDFRFSFEARIPQNLWPKLAETFKTPATKAEA